MFFFSLVEADVNNEWVHEALFAGVEDLRQEYIKKSAELKVKWQFLKKNREQILAFIESLLTI